MIKYITTIVLFLFGLNAQSQIIENQEVSPKGGINTLAIKYFGIEFSKEQRILLKDIEIELIFQIDKKGKPTLAEINGINNIEIIDSLKNKTKKIENFNPRIRNGISEPSIYFMKLTFPSYKMTQSRYAFLQGGAYNEAKLEDFENLKLTNTRLDVMIGGVMNQFIGEPSNYLKFGGGMKTDISFMGKRNYIYGLNMSFYGNNLKKEYPLNTNREQFSAPPTLLFGLIFGKWIDKISIQTELNMAVQNITERLENDDPNWIQLKGWSPGVLINYPIRLGKQKTIYYYGKPSLFENSLNLHFGLRYLFLSIPEASGVMTEIGISYRMTVKGVEEYKLKDEFYTK